MDLIKEALSMGFADAAIMDTKDLVFVPEYRQFCEDNLCGNYNLVPACPPACGTVEEMQAKALKYEKALVLQTVRKGIDIADQFACVEQALKGGTEDSYRTACQTDAGSGKRRYPDHERRTV